MLNRPLNFEARFLRACRIQRYMTHSDVLFAVKQYGYEGPAAWINAPSQFTEEMISQFETGRLLPSFTQFASLCTALQLPLTQVSRFYLYTYKKQMTDEEFNKAVSGFIEELNVTTIFIPKHKQ